MPATPARIAFLLAPFRRAIVEDASVKQKYGETARQSEDPVETFFDHASDAQLVASERQALLGQPRRRFLASAVGLDEAIEQIVDADRVPQVRLVDPEHGVHRSTLAVSLRLDFAAQKCTVGVWG